MKPKNPDKTPQKDLFRMELRNMIDLKHELVRLAEIIDWDAIDGRFGALYEDRKGRPGIPTRMMAGFLYLKHTQKLSDEEVVRRWVENPYMQYFCGEQYFRHDFPIHPTSLTRFRKRMSEKDAQFLLSVTVEAGLNSGTIEKRELKEVVVDTTVMEKAIANPTDSQLYHRCRDRLVQLAKKHGVELRQSYHRKSRYALLKAARYGHAKQYKRMRREVRRLRTWLGCVKRDIERRIAADETLQAVFQANLALAERLLDQRRDSKNKLYSLHAPEVSCIAKGKARKRYEFGVKVGVATTLKNQFVLASHALPGNPYDGHTLADTLWRCAITSGAVAKNVYVDRGYRGHGVGEVSNTKVYIAGQRRGISVRRRRKMKRRSAIEAIIGHMKADGLLARNWLKGSDGDEIHAQLCGAGQNLRMILKKLRLLFAWVSGGYGRGLAAQIRLCSFVKKWRSDIDGEMGTTFMATVA